MWPGRGQVDKDDGQDGICLNHGFTPECGSDQAGVGVDSSDGATLSTAWGTALHAEENIESIENCRRRGEGGRRVDRLSPSD